MSGQSLIELRDLAVARGGRNILDVPSLALRQGEILSLIGPNGAGKSTLLLALSGISRPERGDLLYRGERLAGDGLLAYRRRLAMVFQEPLLFRGTVSDNVASGLRIRGLGRREIERRVAEGLERFRIAHLARRSTRGLSGGEAQRTSLARALALDPEVLLLDEPFASLDPPTREALMDDLEANLRASRTTAVMATHDREEALRLSDRLAVMNLGRILQEGPPAEVTNRPADEFTASFVGVETILECRVASVSSSSFVAESAGHRLEAVGEAQVGEEVLLCIRPENVTLAERPPAERTSARNVMLGSIERLAPMGPLEKVTINCGFPLAAWVTRQSSEEMRLAPGRIVAASVKATAIHVIRRKGPAPQAPPPGP